MPTSVGQDTSATSGGYRPSVGEVTALLAALPVATSVVYQQRIAPLRACIADANLGPGDPIPISAGAYLADLIAVAMLLPLTTRRRPAPEHIAGLLHGVVGSPAALGHLVVGKLIVDRLSWREAPPSRYVSWEDGLLWLPDALLDLFAAYGDLEVYALTDRRRWLLDPSFPVPLRQRAVLLRQGMVTERRQGRQRRTLIAANLEDLRLKAAPWARPWVDVPVEIADIQTIAGFDRFVASCILLNRGHRPIEGWLEFASHAKAGQNAPRAVDRVVNELNDVDLGLPPATAYALMRGVRFLFRSQSDPVADFVTTWWRIRGFFIDSLREQDRSVTHSQDHQNLAVTPAGGRTARGDLHV